MVYPQGKLIGVCDYFRRCGEGTSAKRALWIIRQGISLQESRNLRIDRHEQCVAGKGSGIDSQALIRSRHGKHLRSSQNLAEALIFGKELRPSTVIVEMRNGDRPTDCQAELISPEGVLEVVGVADMDRA